MRARLRLLAQRHRLALRDVNPPNKRLRGTKLIKRIACFALGGLWAAAAAAQVNVTTEAYDNNRSASNLNETILNTSNVNSAQFGKLFSQPLDGSPYAQPLYVSNVSVNGVSHNVVYVATMNDSVYAFDADNNVGANASPLWKVNFLSPPAVVAPPSNGNYITNTVGITSTPVIDMTSGTLYVVALTSESTGYVYRLHALDITSGTEKFGGPVVISGFVPGTGPGSSAGTLTFNPNQHLQRAALALANGAVFIAFGSFGDSGTWHGWVMGYDEKTLAQTTIYCVTPNGLDGAIWMAGRGPVVDSSGNLYYMTANGDYDGLTSFSDSFVKLSTANETLTQVDWFAPDDFAYLEDEDYDLGSSGPLAVPGANVILGGGKYGGIYVLNMLSLGEEQIGNGQIPEILSIGSLHIFSAPAFYNRSTGAGPWMYVWPMNGYLSAYHFNGATLDATPVSQSTFPGESNSFPASLALSANGNTAGTGIVWAAAPATPGNFSNGTNPGVLYAFDASNLSTMLWSSNINATRDSAGIWAKFRSPVAANGGVYVGSFQNPTTGAPAALNVYGLLSAGSGIPTASVSFVGKDTTTKGNWIGVYGADGYSLAGSSQSFPSYASFALQGNATYTWATPADTRALEIPTGGRIAACWFGKTFTMSVNIAKSGTPHEVSLYFLDWDNQARSEVVQVLDAGTSTPLDTETINNFSGGAYLSWMVTGNVAITVTLTSGPNAAVSAILFGGATASASTTAPTAGNSTGTAAFVKYDTSTEGTWSGVYGSTGYSLAQSVSSVPTSISFSVQGGSVYTWANPTTDPRALQVPAGGRIAATWTGGKFAFDINFTDGNQHQLAVYALDWDSKGRSESIQINDSVGNLLDSRTISNYENGEYLVWNVTGSIVVTISSVGGPNAVISGAFFDPAGGAVASRGTVTGTITFQFPNGVTWTGPATITVPANTSQQVTFTIANGTGGQASITPQN